MGEAGWPLRLCQIKGPQRQRLEVRVVCGKLKGHFGGPQLYLRAMFEGIQTWLAEPAAVGGGRLNKEGWPRQSLIGGGEDEDESKDGDCKPTPRKSWCTPFDVFQEGSFVPSCWQSVGSSLPSDKGCGGWCLGAAWLWNTSGDGGEKLLTKVWKTLLPLAMMTWKTLNNEGRGRLKID